MARTITLKYDATCKDCGTEIAAGETARWYGRGRVYGTTCHEQKPQRQTAAQRARADIGRGTLAFQYSHGQINEAQYRSACDPTGFYNAAGELIGRTNPAGRCEDAPCCGCCS